MRSQREFCRGFANWNEIVGKRADLSTFKRQIRLGTESADIAGVITIGRANTKVEARETCWCDLIGTIGFDGATAGVLPP